VRALETRLNRAKHHLNRFNIQVDKFLATKPYGIAPAELNPKGTHYLFKAQVLRETPPIIGLLASDFVHNLASLLDNVVWRFAPPSERKRRDLHFFQCSSLPEFQKQIRPKLARFDQAFIATIERHQPYHRDEGFRNDRLVLLRQLWNDDKHHVPVIVGAAAVASVQIIHDPNPPAWLELFYGPFDPGKVIGRIGIKASPQDRDNPRFVFGVALETARPRIRVPSYTLGKMYDIVANEVLPDFAKLV
jgi:hypothetical protein